MNGDAWRDPHAPGSGDGLGLFDCDRLVAVGQDCEETSGAWLWQDGDECRTWYQSVESAQMAVGR